MEKPNFNDLVKMFKADPANTKFAPAAMMLMNQPAKAITKIIGNTMMPRYKQLLSDVRMEALFRVIECTYHDISTKTGIDRFDQFISDQPGSLAKINGETFTHKYDNVTHKLNLLMNEDMVSFYITNDIDMRKNSTYRKTYKTFDMYNRDVGTDDISHSLTSHGLISNTTASCCISFIQSECAIAVRTTETNANGDKLLVSSNLCISEHGMTGTDFICLSLM